jgi:hypothetical protein
MYLAGMPAGKRQRVWKFPEQHAARGIMFSRPKCPYIPRRWLGNSTAGGRSAVARAVRDAQWQGPRGLGYLDRSVGLSLGGVQMNF